jgi:hypothetical protein
MEYEIEYTDDAADVLSAMPAWLQDITNRHVEQVAAHPITDETTRLPREGDCAYRSGFRHGPVGGIVHHIDVYFDVFPGQSALTDWKVRYQREDPTAASDWPMH